MLQIINAKLTFLTRLREEQESEDSLTQNNLLIVPQHTWAQLFEGRLALNLGLNLTRVSFSFIQKHFLG